MNMNIKRNEDGSLQLPEAVYDPSQDKLIQDLETYKALSDEIREDEAALKISKQHKVEMQQKILGDMAARKMQSTKVDGTSYSITKKPKANIVDEQAVMDELVVRGIDSSYIKTSIDKTAFNTLAGDLLRNGGEIFPGTEIVETEYLSVRTPKKAV